jgi:Kef-type K+ transport system membrane component KefB
MVRTRIVSFAIVAYAAASLGSSGGNATLLAVVALILACAKLFGAAFERIGMPSVLGELTAGIALGNLDQLGTSRLEFISTDANLAFLGELGVILLLFQVGLESNLGQMAKVGIAAFVVACVGVILPMALGYGLHAALSPESTWHTHLFIGAVLSATSVGITARVFKDLGKIDSGTGRVVLGAAVIDDVLGLIVLAVVSGIVVGAQTGESLATGEIVLLVGKAFGFLGVAILLGPRVSKQLYHAASALRLRQVLLASSLAFCLVISWLAHLVELAPIVGAFAAGLVLDEVVYKDLADREDHRLEDLLEPLGQILTPVFFVLTGAAVDLSVLGDPDAVLLAGALIVAAVIGKQACSLVAFGSDVHKLSVGIGMIPRGEVGLIFAAQGAALGVVTSTAYASIVIMVMFTTMVTPPVLAWSLRRA